MSKFEQLIRNMLFLNLSDAEALREAPSSFLLLKYGTTRYTKGKEQGEYDFGPEDADKVLADWQERGKDIVVDYEHQTLSGKEAPAAGWIERLEKTADGIVAHLKAWTEKATNYLKNGEYRYFSPVLYTSRRRPFGIHSVALTNHPATHCPEVLAMFDEFVEEPQTNNTETKNMNELLQQLGLVALADDAANKAAVAARISELLNGETAVKGFLTLHDCKGLEAVTGKIAGMVPAAEKSALESRLAGIEAEKAVAQAFTDGKLVEAQRNWAVKYATADLQAFSDFVAKAPKVAPDPAAAVDTKKTETKVVALSDGEIKILRTQGLSDEDIEAIRKERSAK